MKRNMQIFIFVFIALLPTRLIAEVFIAHCRNYPPELYFENNRCIGVLPDLVSDIFTELGHKIVWKKVPWVRSIKDAEACNVDLMIRHSTTPEREPILHPIKYASYTRTLYFYKSSKFKADIKSYQELNEANIGAVRGVFYSPKFSKINMKEHTQTKGTNQLLGMLALGRIDVVATSASHNIELFDARFEKVSLVDTFVNSTYISIPKKSKMAHFHKEIAMLMLEYRKIGKINQYFEKYGLPAPAQFFE